MPINTNEISELLSISPGATDVYIELLTHGELSAKQLDMFMQYTPKEIKPAIKELKEKGLITKINSIDDTEIYHALSLLQLEEKMERERTVLSSLKKIILPRLQNPEKLGIVKYEGWEGIRRVYVEILEEAINTGENIIAFESNVDKSDIGELFLKNYIDKRIKSKVKAFVISPLTEMDKKYKDRYQGEYTEAKLLSDFPIDASINVVGNLVMTFSVDNPRGTLRRNLAEANTWRAIFWEIWHKN